VDAEIQNTKVLNKRKKIDDFIVDETLIKIGFKLHGYGLQLRIL